jgi:hypothetical protein
MPTHTGNPPATLLATETGNPNKPSTETGNPPSVRLGTETGNPTIVANVGQGIQIFSEIVGNKTFESVSQPVWAQLREGNLVVSEGESVTGIFMAGSFQGAQLDRKDDG